MGLQRVIFLLPTATVAAAAATRIQHIPTLAGLAGICTLVVVGGDGTMSACALLVDRGVNCIGIPKTIDNDCFATEVLLSPYHSLVFISATCRVLVHCVDGTGGPYAPANRLGLCGCIVICGCSLLISLRCGSLTMRTAICMVCSGTQYPQCSRHGNTPLALI